MATRPLTQVRRRGVQELAALRSENQAASIQAAQNLIGEARDFGLNLRDYLTLAIDVPGSEEAARYQDGSGFLSGYEASLAYLQLPVADDFSRGVVLDAASDTFQTFPGTRALFPEVVDDMVRWKYRQESIENTGAIVAQSRTISGIEMISTVVDDKADDYQTVRAVSELGRMPVRTIRTGETAVKFYKHGGGLRYSYEFNRRARIDLLTPYQNRMARETERSKVWTATGILINGDGVNGAAGVVTQSSLDSGATTGKISRKGLVKWLINRAKAGTPVDTVLGNWDAYLEWLELFAVNKVGDRSEVQDAAVQGFQLGGVPLLQGIVNFALSSAVPANRLVGFSKGDTLEELIEAGSNIEESERSIQNQSITVVKSENAGYKLAFSDTREVYNFGA
jgi:hypothetical protein